MKNLSPEDLIKTIDSVILAVEAGEVIGLTYKGAELAKFGGAGLPDNSATDNSEALTACLQATGSAFGDDLNSFAADVEKAGNGILGGAR